MPTLDRDVEVFVLNIGDTENRFGPEWLAEVQEHLDTVASWDGPRALVTTATGKFFSNGLDLEWLGEHSDQLPGYIIDVHHLFGSSEKSVGHGVAG